jgi:microcystin-dependent protein
MDSRIPADLIRAEITARTTSSGTYVYSWKEKVIAPATGALTDAVPGRTGSATSSPAYEANNYAVSTGTQVLLRLRGIKGGQLIYEFDAPGGPLTVQRSDGTQTQTGTTLQLAPTAIWSVTSATTGTVTCQLASASGSAAGYVTAADQFFKGSKYLNSSDAWKVVGSTYEVHHGFVTAPWGGDYGGLKGTGVRDVNFVLDPVYGRAVLYQGTGIASYYTYDGSRFRGGQTLASSTSYPFKFVGGLFDGVNTALGDMIYGNGLTWARLSAGSDGQFLKLSGGVPTWTTVVVGSGTVTSVGLSLPSIFSVTGSPVSTSGTLTATLASQSANRVFAGPSTGAAAAPTFRALVAADLPSSGVSADTYGSATQVAQITTNAQGQVTAASNVTIAVVPTGMIAPYAGSSAPTGYLLCDGSAVSRTTYATLFALIGTTYGSGDGSTTFNVPDLRGRVPMGVDGTAARVTSASTGGANADTLGGAGGAETHTLGTTQIPSHSHQQQKAASPTGGTLEYYTIAGTTGSTPTGNSRPATQTTGGGDAHSNTQPWLALNFIIKT